MLIQKNKELAGPISFLYISHGLKNQDLGKPNTRKRLKMKLIHKFCNSCHLILWILVEYYSDTYYLQINKWSVLLLSARWFPCHQIYIKKIHELGVTATMKRNRSNIFIKLVIQWCSRYEQYFMNIISSHNFFNKQFSLLIYYKSYVP